MKKTVKILSVLLGFILAFTPILSLTVSADDAAYGKTSTYNAEYSNETTRGKLAITEILAGKKGEAEPYQYIEVMNVSSETITLSDYYLYRVMRGNASGANETVTNILLGEGAWSAGANWISKIQITTNTNTTLASGEVAVLFLKWDTTKDEATFRTYWNLDQQTKVVTVTVDSSVAVKSNYSSNANGGNNGFLPDHYVDCIISLVHKDATISVNGTPTKICEADATNTKDVNDATKINHAGYFDERYVAADCNAVLNTDGWESSTLSHNFYGWANMNDCDELISYTGNFSNFVASKLTATGTYEAATNNGVVKYVNANDGLEKCFISDGTDAAATPGTLNAGQFGYNSIKVLGYQTNTENDLRIVASFEADALMANAVGFEIVASIGGTEKILDKECYKVYAKLGGSVKVGDDTVSPLDQAYLATVGAHDYYVALTITDIDADVTFTVKPYVLNGTLKEYGETATITYTAPQA